MDLMYGAFKSHTEFRSIWKSFSEFCILEGKLDVTTRLLYEFHESEFLKNEQYLEIFSTRQINCQKGIFEKVLSFKKVLAK